MRELLQSMKQNFKQNIKKIGKKFLNRYLDFGAYIEDSLHIEGEAESEEIDLEPLQEYMSEYIGMMVLGIKGFSKDIVFKDLETIRFKTVSDCRLVKDSIELHLSHPNGKPSGYIRISPSKHGSFAERDPGAIPVWSSRYRILFYGGDTLEYLDPEKQGSIEYIKG